MSLLSSNVPGRGGLQETLCKEDVLYSSFQSLATAGASDADQLHPKDSSQTSTAVVCVCLSDSDFSVWAYKKLVPLSLSSQPQSVCSKDYDDDVELKLAHRIPSAAPISFLELS